MERAVFYGEDLKKFTEILGADIEDIPCCTYCDIRLVPGWVKSLTLYYHDNHGAQPGITISQWYVHPWTETVELAFEHKMDMDKHRLPTVFPQDSGAVAAFQSKFFLFNKPGWRNRQTQRT